jgi:hypothetical protein
MKKKPKTTRSSSEEDSASSNGDTHQISDGVAKGRAPTADTLKALEELKAGKLTRYDDEDDLFRKLGIKLGLTGKHEDIFK